MSYIFDWANKDTKALVFLKGSALKTLIAYTLFADDHGNAWCSTNSNKAGGLNKVTGLSHDAIAGVDGSRRVLIDHGCIEAVDKETVKLLYSGRPVGKRPPVNAEVYHITKMIRHCAAGCTCKQILQAPPEGVYVFLTSKESGHEVDSSPDPKEVVATARRNIFTVYESNIGVIGPTLRDELVAIESEYPEGWFEDAVKEAVLNNVRKMSYIKAILADWKVKGRGNGKAAIADRKPAFERIGND